MTPSRSESPRRAMRLAPTLAAITIAVGASAARAEVVVQEDQFTDWVGRCETETTTGEVICFIYTGRVAEVEGESLAARLVVGVGDQMQPIVYLDLPDIAEPSNGFMLQVDTREPFSGLFSNCSTGWCHTQATGEIAADLISQFRVGAEATASFILEGEETRVDMPLSLMGFTAAYTRLQQIHEEAAANTPPEPQEPRAEPEVPADETATDPDEPAEEGEEAEAAEEPGEAEAANDAGEAEADATEPEDLETESAPDSGDEPVDEPAVEPGQSPDEQSPADEDEEPAPDTGDTPENQ